LPALCAGGFVERGDNLLAFGLPGRGKTHLVCAIAHELILRGYRVLFIATFALVQRLLVAKRDLRLEQELAVLDGFDAVVCDDIGYVQQNRDEMEVPVHLPHRALRVAIGDHHQQPRVQRVGPDLQRPDDHHRRHRPPRPSRRDPRDDRHQHPRRARARARARARRARGTRRTFDDNYSDDNDRRGNQRSNDNYLDDNYRLRNRRSDGNDNDPITDHPSATSKGAITTPKAPTRIKNREPSGIGTDGEM
jgi:hypothetical protein